MRLCIWYAIFVAIKLLAPASVYINRAAVLLTCFTVSTGKARLTVALVFMMGIFSTCCSVFTIEILVTMQFCNTSWYLLLLYFLLATYLPVSEYINDNCLAYSCSHISSILSLFPSIMLRRMLHKLIYKYRNSNIPYVITLRCTISAITLLTNFTAFSGEASTALALVWLMCSIFLTCCSILTLVLVTVLLCNTVLFRQLLNQS